MQARRFAAQLSLLIPFTWHAALTCAAKEPPAPRVVDLTAADGTKLKASYFSAGKAGPGVLLLHQCDHERKIWDGLAQKLAAAEINVLTFDLRGFGESGGEPHDKVPPMGSPEQIQKWPEDIDTAFQFLKSQPGVKADAMGVGGASCGVDNAIHTAIRHPEVKSLVLLAGPTDLQGRQFLRQSKLPVFFAVADDDPYQFVIPMTEFLCLLTASPGKKFAHYQTGHHGAEIFSVHPDLPAAIVDWYVTTLIKTPGRAPVSKDVPAIPSELRTWDLLDQPGGPAKVAQMLSESRQKDPKAPFISEEIIERFLYDYLQAGDTKQALEILKLSAVNPNVYDLDLLEQPGGPAKLAQTLAESRQKDPKASFISEQIIEGFAYVNLQAGDTKHALEILKLNAAAYPNSPQAYDVLGGVYLADGQKELARQNTQKALDLLPSDTVDPQNFRDAIKASAEERLKKLGPAQ